MDWYVAELVIERAYLYTLIHYKQCLSAKATDVANIVTINKTSATA